MLQIIKKIFNFASICTKLHHEPNTDDKTTKQDEENYSLIKMAF